MSTSNDDPLDRAILAAAKSCIEDFGVRRTTLAEVARRAGVSRPTVYRRWPDTRSLIGELLDQEFRSIVAPAAKQQASGRAQLVAVVVTGSASVRENPLFQKIFRTDTDIVLTYVVERLGRSQRALVAAFGDAIRAGQLDGSVRQGDPLQLATMVLLIVQSAVQSAQIVADTLAGDALDTELAYAIDGYLRPTGDRP